MGDRLSLVAGSGALVPEVVEAALERGYATQVLSLVARRVPAGVDFVRISVADLQPAFGDIRRFGATIVAMAGALSLSDARREALLDIAGGGTSRGDTAMSRLAGVVEEQTGARLVGVQEIAPNLVAPQGHIAGPPPSGELLEVGAFALGVARRAGRLDAGQGVVVAGRRVVGLEDIAGTDALLLRVAAYRRRGLTGDGRSPLVFAKAAKPDQPMIIDLPAIGPKTIANARRAGIQLLAVEAGATLLIQREAMAKAALAAKLPVVGIRVND